jgi:hypothetical protein
MKPRLVLVMVGVSWSWLLDIAPVQNPSRPIPVSRQALVQAMTRQKAERYNLLATANGARLSSAVILEVALRASQSDVAQTPILIDHRDYFGAYLEVNGITRDSAPAFMQVAADHGEDQYIDYRRDRIIAKVVAGAPKFAVTVVAGWPNGPKADQRYSYEDRTSTPALRVTHERINSYRLLDCGDMIVFDEIEGVTGRALGGLLGAMFAVIGDGRAVRSFVTVATDGIQVTVTTARKGILSVTQEAVVYPTGRGEKGIPRDRPDLSALEARLRQPFEIQYKPLSYPDPATWRQ